MQAAMQVVLRQARGLGYAVAASGFASMSAGAYRSKFSRFGEGGTSSNVGGGGSMKVQDFDSSSHGVGGSSGSTTGTSVNPAGSHRYWKLFLYAVPEDYRPLSATAKKRSASATGAAGATDAVGDIGASSLPPGLALLEIKLFPRSMLSASEIALHAKYETSAYVAVAAKQNAILRAAARAPSVPNGVLLSM
jgi:hypothetical protein